MADQNPQINQNVDNQNENDELFGGSDDIFENSDLLQPINNEVDTAHQVIKSQNDLNNFSGEVQNNFSEQQQVTPEFNSDDLFEEKTQEQSETNEHFANLYDETLQENQTQTNDVSINDDIFEEGPVVEDKIEDIPEVEYIPEIEDLAKENEPQTDEIEEDVKDEESMQEPVQESEVVEIPEIVENPESESIEESSQNIQATQDEEYFDDIDELDDINDDIDEINDREDDNENIDEGKDDEVIVEKQEETGEEKVEGNVENEVENNEDDEEDEEGFIQNEEENEDEDDFDSTNNIQEEGEEVKESSDDDIETTVVQNYEKYDPNLFKTDVQKKFGELQRKTEKIHELVGKDMDVGFDLLGGNDDRQKTTYKILSGSDYITIEKNEFNKEDESNLENTLEFVLEEDLEQNTSVSVIVNDVELYDEFNDLQKDPNKKMQVMEKMNKFIFLLDEEYKKIQKYKKEKEERNAVKGVFRNF